MIELCELNNTKSDISTLRQIIYPFHPRLLADIKQAFMSATIITEQVELSSPDNRDYCLIQFQTPICTSSINGAQSDGLDVVGIIYSGDSMLTQRCNESLVGLGGKVELGFRWHGIYDGEKRVNLQGFSLKMIYPDTKSRTREAVFKVIALEFEKASLVTNHTDFHAWMFPLLLSSIQPPRPSVSNAARLFKTPRALPEIEAGQLNAVTAYIREHISAIQPLYSRENEISINPSYQNSDAISCPLELNQKKIWLLRTDFVLAMGNKNSYWTNFKDSSLAEAIETDLHAHVNWEDRYGHPSLAAPHLGYDGSAYYGGYLAQRDDHIELYIFSGRYHRNDLNELNKEILEAYIAYYFQKAYGDQLVVFTDAVISGPRGLDNFDLSIFLRDDPLPEYCTRRAYNREKIILVFDRCAIDLHSKSSTLSNLGY